MDVLSIAKQWGDPVLFVATSENMILVAYIGEKVDIVFLPPSLINTETSDEPTVTAEMVWDKRLSIDTDKSVAYCKQQISETPYNLQRTRYFWRRLIRILREKFGEAEDKIANETEDEVLKQFVDKINYNFMLDLVMQGYLKKMQEIMNLVGYSMPEVEKKVLSKMMSVNGNYTKEAIKSRLDALGISNIPDTIT